jgi:hypothetical protein
LNDLSTEDLLTLRNFLSTEFMNLWWWFYVTPSRQTWAPQQLRNKVLKQLVNCRMIRPALKSLDVCDNRKNDKLKIEWKTKILFFTFNHNTIDVWRWIFVQSMKSQKEIFNYEK